MTLPPLAPSGDPTSGLPPAPSATAFPAAPGVPTPEAQRAPWVLPVVAATVVVGLVLSVAIVAGAVLVGLGLSQDDAGTSWSVLDEGMDEVGGVVTDASGAVVEDGTGGWDHPGTIGEHAVAWESWEGGTATVSITAAETGYELPGRENLVQPGYTLLHVMGEVRYEGPGSLVPAEQIGVGVETDLAYIAELGPGIASGSLVDVPAVESGNAGVFEALFVVSEAELASGLVDLTGPAGDFYYALG